MQIKNENILLVVDIKKVQKIEIKMKNMTFFVDMTYYEVPHKPVAT